MAMSVMVARLVLPLVVIGVTLVFVYLIVLLGLRAAQAHRELLSRERQAAIERGQRLPAEAYLDPEVGRRAPGNSLRWGLVFVGLGAGLAAALRVVAPETTLWGWGLVPLVVGGAHLVYWYVVGAREWREHRAFEAERTRALLARGSDAGHDEVREG